MSAYEWTMLLLTIFLLVAFGSVLFDRALQRVPWAKIACTVGAIDAVIMCVLVFLHTHATRLHLSRYVHYIVLTNQHICFGIAGGIFFSIVLAWRYEEKAGRHLTKR